MSRQGRRRARTYGNVKSFWDAEAQKWGNSPQVTIRDHYFRIHELNTLLSVIPSCRRLLDIGCGTGFGTIFLSRKSQSTLGMDYSADMLRWARKLACRSYREKVTKHFSPLWASEVRTAKVRFEKGDILDLDPSIGRFDVITGQRILINMADSGKQFEALTMLRKRATPDAMLVLVEATMEGHRFTDEFRAKFGLPILEKYWHNFYVEENRAEDWRNAGWDVRNILTFDTYMLLSKVIYPAACGQDNCSFLSGANKAAMEIANVFRSEPAVHEIGLRGLLELYLGRVRLYDEGEWRKIGAWAGDNLRRLRNWRGLGHQKMIIAHAR